MLPAGRTMRVKFGRCLRSSFGTSAFLLILFCPCITKQSGSRRIRGVFLPEDGERRALKFRIRPRLDKEADYERIEFEHHSRAARRGSKLL